MLQHEACNNYRSVILKDLLLHSSSDIKTGESTKYTLLGTLAILFLFPLKGFTVKNRFTVVQKMPQQ